MIELIVVLLASVGFVISIYFTGVFYKWLKPDVFWMPRVCRLEEKTCLHVLDTPRAKIFGIPNSAMGIFAYAYVLLDLFYFPAVFGFGLITLALIRSIYLAYSLLYVTKIPCPLCFTSHAINLTLFLVYTYSNVFI